MKTNKNVLQAEKIFWQNFRSANSLKQDVEIPERMKRVNFRIIGVNDEGLRIMTGAIKHINQLDLDDTSVTNDGIAHLQHLETLNELRLKECMHIDDESMDTISKLTTLTLLHIGGTNISLNAMKQISTLTNLKTLLISAPANSDENLTDIAILLPPDCELIVNHRLYELG